MQNGQWSTVKGGGNKRPKPIAKNVFGSESEPESEPERPPPKKLRPTHEPEWSSTSSEDYMSDSYLEAPPESVAKPSLDTPILGSASVGFQMMLKMGYKPGQPLGVSGASLVEPLKIAPKASRAGIGHKRQIVKPPAADTARVYIDSQKDKLETARKRALTRKLQRFCFVASGEEALFHDGELTVDKVQPLWRNAAEELCELSVDSLPELLRYCRDAFLYCPYCSVQYASVEDMQNGCPGENEESHEDCG